MNNKFRSNCVISNIEIGEECNSTSAPVVCCISSLKDLTLYNLKYIFSNMDMYKSFPGFVYVNVGNKSLKITIRDGIKPTRYDYSLCLEAIRNAWCLSVMLETENIMYRLLDEVHHTMKGDNRNEQ